MSDNITPIAWGQPLVAEKTELVIGRVTGLTGPMTQYLPQVMDPNAVYWPVLNVGQTLAIKEAIAKINYLNDKIEEDITYFNTIKGQSLAIHKLATLKVHLKEVINLLEK